MNKPLLLFILALLFAIPEVFSQSPQSFKYQAVVRDGSNSPLINQAIKVRMSILVGNIGGNSVYTEIHEVTTDNLGLISLNIGEGTQPVGEFGTITWGDETYFLQLELDESGGNNFQILGASQLMSVPYSLYANRAGKVDDLSLDDLVDTDASAPIEGSLLTWDGSNWVAGSSTGIDDDRDSTNELQMLDLTGNILNISNGNSVALPFPFNGGTGITVTTSPTGSIITNTGDVNPNDDITTTSIAGGDLSGTFDNLNVAKIQGREIALNAPTINDVLKWNGTEWTPAADNVATGGGAINTTGRISGDGSIATPLDLAQQGAIANQVLTWNGSSWAPADLPPETTFFAGNGIVLSNDSIINTAPDQAISLVGGGATVIGGTYPNYTISSIDNNTTYTAGTGIAISPTNEVTNVGDTDPSDDITTVSTANGDISGTYTNLSVDKIKGNEVSPAAPAIGQVYKWTGTEWAPDIDANTTYTAGTGIAISPTNEVSNSGDTDPSDDITTSSVADGDISGIYTNLSVDKIKGNDIAATAPAAGEVLKWNGTAWAPGADLVSTGGGAVNTTGRFSGDGSAGSPLDIAPQGAGVGEVLKWNGTTWAPGGDENTSYTAGTGIGIIGTTIINNAPDQTVSLTAAGATSISGTYPNFIISSTDNVDDADANPSNEIQSLSLLGSTLSISSANSVVLPTYSAGDGIILSNDSIINTAPDQTVSLTGAGATAISGTYPNFTISSANTEYTAGSGIDITGTTISNDAPDQTVSLTGAGATAISGTYPNFTISSTNTEYTAGSGIDITGTTISNDAPDQTVSLTGAGATAISGTYPNFTISSANTEYTAGSGIDITGTTISNDAPDQTVSLTGAGATSISGTYPNFTINSTNTTYTAGTGISITGNIINNEGDTNPLDDITTASVAGGDVSGFFSSLSVDKINGNAVAASAPGVGQVLKWNGSAWAPSTDVNTTYAAGSGIDITGTTITNSSPDQTVGLTGGGATSVTGVYPNFTITSTDDNTTYTAGSGIDITGTTITNSSPDQTVGLTGGGATSVTGVYPNFTITSTDNNTTYTAGSGIDIIGTSISNSLPDQTVSLTGTGATSITGIYPNFVINSTDNNTTYTAGAGISIVGTTVSNTGDINAADDILNTTPAGGDVSGTFGALTVDNIKGNPVSAAVPDSFQVLKWNGSEWAPDFDEEGLITWDINGSTAFYDGGNVSIGSDTSTHQLQISEDNLALRLVGTESPTGYGAQINFGDEDFVYLKEYVENVLEIYGAEGILLDTKNFILERDGDIIYEVDSMGNAGYGAIHDSVVLNITGDVGDRLLFCAESGDTTIFKVYPNGDVVTNGDVVGDHFFGRRINIEADSAEELLIFAENIQTEPRFKVDTAGNVSAHGDLISNGDVKGSKLVAFPELDPLEENLIIAQNLGGSQRFLVDTAGNVNIAGNTFNEGTLFTLGNTGIGGFSPLAKLNINASATNRDIFLGWNSTGDTRFRIDTSGAVTIGSANTPTHKLQIEEDTMALRLIGTKGSGPGFSVGYGAQLNFGDEDYVYLKEYADDKFRINATGGIRMTTPSLVIGSGTPTSTKKLIVEDSLFLIDVDGRSGFNRAYDDTRLNVGGASGDDYIFTAERSNNDIAFEVLENGKSGFGRSYDNVKLTIHPDPADDFILYTENEGGLFRFLVDTVGNGSFNGMVSKSGGTFKIDHPLDPANKYLYHSFVESPDMMNVYNGNITTDAQGYATVTMPDYFMSLNKDFRYQLTVIGTFAQAIIKEKVNNNRFIIQTSEPNVEVSWQVTGIRQDKFAEKNRVEVEVEKSPEERGYYLHPELYDQPVSKQVGKARRKSNLRTGKPIEDAKTEDIKKLK